ncbi:MAG TPA: hypothetical protein DEQ56_07610 [Bacteroidetes bacterium]|jgi:hypothetical protein|nr:hypothetical protein [Bacteroidota bacterium]
MEQIVKNSQGLQTLENDFYRHEAQCEERWKTCFYRLEELDKSMRRIESRMIVMGGTVIMFLAGLVVTLSQMGVPQ